MSLDTLFPIPSSFNEADPQQREALHALLHGAHTTAKHLEAFKQVIGAFEPVKIYDALGMVVEVLGKRAGRDFGVGGPWQFFDASDSSGDRKVLINLHSHLAQSIRSGDKVTITGLGQSFPVNAGDYIYLEVTLLDNKVKKAEVKHGQKWAEYPEVIRYEGTYPDLVQTGFYLELGYVVAAGDSFEFDPPGLIIGSGASAVVVIRMVHQHLALERTCDAGETTVVYVKPWFGQHIPRF